LISLHETGELLKTIKLSCPRFSVPAKVEDLEKLTKVWHYALNVDVDYPAFVFEDAVGSYFAAASKDDNAPLPGDIRAHCKRVIDRIEVDPVRGPNLRKWREDKARERDARLNGT